KDDDSRRPMTDQEYLDRQDEFTINFFLTGDNSWDRTTAIYINSWRVVPKQDSSL
ncbi:MAG: FimB/Mfa2 family fimbrial subunit, partial [Muribaculum sp.]|nr:FimB/Mfa2 family fimbrial subunit [Muribaculum sp.]